MSAGQQINTARLGGHSGDHPPFRRPSAIQKASSLQEAGSQQLRYNSQQTAASLKSQTAGLVRARWRLGGRMPERHPSPDVSAAYDRELPFALVPRLVVAHGRTSKSIGSSQAQLSKALAASPPRTEKSKEENNAKCSNPIAEDSSPRNSHLKILQRLRTRMRLYTCNDVTVQYGSGTLWPTTRRKKGSLPPKLLRRCFCSRLGPVAYIMYARHAERISNPTAAGIPEAAYALSWPGVDQICKVKK